VRVAALYDIHGNVPALEAVLAEAEPEADAFVVGGDIVGTDRPREVLELLRALDAVHWIRGNVERELIEPGPPREGGPPPGSMEELKAALAPKDVDFLFGLPAQVTLEVDGLGEVFFCHATPRNDYEIFTIYSPDEKILEMLDGVPVPVVACGHTHVQCDRRVGDYRVVNAGSVGMPYEPEPGAYWALLGPDVDLRRTGYEGAQAPLATREEASEYFESIS
jgi:predicted phosphodiesterase